MVFTYERSEQKFLLSQKAYETIRQVFDNHMKEDQYGWQSICNIYFDDDHSSLIRKSIENKKFKEKVRLRSYCATTANDDIVHFELKRKLNGITYKRRLTEKLSVVKDYLEGKTKTLGGKNPQVEAELKFFLNVNKLKPRIFISYDRIALKAESDSDLRITFDTNLLYRRNNLNLSENYGTPYFTTPHYIMEIKTLSSLPLWLCNALTEQKIFSTSFSKYGKIFLLEGEKCLKQSTRINSAVS